MFRLLILLFCYMQFLGTDDVVQESEKNTQLLDVTNLGKRRRNRKQNTHNKYYRNDDNLYTPELVYFGYFLLFSIY